VPRESVRKRYPSVAEVNVFHEAGVGPGCRKKKMIITIWISTNNGEEKDAQAASTMDWILNVSARLTLVELVRV